jgi:drug/metabolite transporter (DMT)-like permease
MTKNKSKGIFFVAAVLWGMSYAVQKPLLESIDPVVFTFWNFFLSGIAFLVYAVVKQIPITYRWKEGVVLGFFLCGMEILEMVGLKMTSSANTVFLTNLGMLIIPFVGYLFFRKSVKKEDSVAILIAIVGMYFLVGGMRGFGLGEGVLLLSALSSAFYFMYSERFEAEKARHITTLCVQQFFVISLVCFVWSEFVGTSFGIPEGVRFDLLWQIVAFTAVPYSIIQWASRWADEIIAAIYDGVVEPLTGAFMSWFIFSEATSVLKILGGMMMVVSFIFAAVATRRHFIYMKIRGIIQKEIIGA